MSNKNEVFEYLIDALRHQVNNNPYKQQCEDLAHEVQSLKNQLRDMSEVVEELQETIKLMNEDFKRTTANPEYREELRQYYKDMMSVPEQSGCRKEDAQGCAHNWIIAPGLFIAEGHKDNVPGSRFCCECGAREWDDNGYNQKADTHECEHAWYRELGQSFATCSKCGSRKS